MDRGKTGIQAFLNFERNSEVMTSAIERLSRTPYSFAIPSVGTPDVPQDAEFVDVTFAAAPEKHSRCERIGFHNYRAIYQHRGLYEFLFHGRLQF